jgi:AmmeMemoRadiSam system protein B
MIARATLAGTWYPAHAHELEREVRGHLDAARTPADPRVRALIAPHAGYQYSGRCAGAAYARVPRDRFRRAIVLAPSHRHAFRGAAVHPADGFETPLGSIAVDRDGVESLLRAPGYFSDPSAYRGEHSLEIHLPFLQAVDARLTVVPVLVGAEQSSAALEVLSEGVRRVADEDTLVVVSSDFTHFGRAFGYLPFPDDNAEHVSEELRRLDHGAIDPILAGDARAFGAVVASTSLTVCGRAPIIVFLAARVGDLAATLVSYYTSLDVTGDFRHSVSYAAIVFRQRW